MYVLPAVPVGGKRNTICTGRDDRRVDTCHCGNRHCFRRLGGRIWGTHSKQLPSELSRPRKRTKSSAPLFFKDVPYTTVLGIRYFAFVYDAQETQNSQRISIDDVTVKVDSQTVWSSTEAIFLNGSGGNLTLTPLGNGADFALSYR